MDSGDEGRAPYVVPRYRAEGDPAWYHMLHGTVPGHQIDFMYCPDVPQGLLSQTHFGHLARLMKYIEPRQGAPYAFALGNLSRDDVQHEPGHGGLALIFALRVAGVTDHAGRAMPPYAHGVLAIDRALDYGTLLEAIGVFYRRFLDAGPEADDATGSFYRSYVRVMEERPAEVKGFLHDYVADFDELPQPQRSTLGWDWEADDEALPKRVTLVHADDEPFGNVAHAAAMLGAMLYKSNIKWTTITSGREIEIPGGISIRFVPASEAPRDPKGLVIPLHELPEQEAALAEKIFGAKSRRVETKARRAGWREALAAPKGEDAAAGSSQSGTASPAVRGSVRPPPIPSTPPARPSAPEADAFDEAATIPAALEPDPAALAADARRSSSVKAIPSAPAPGRSQPPASTAPDIAAPAPAKSTPAAAPSGAPPPSPPRVESAPPPSHDVVIDDSALSEPSPAPKSRAKVWIGVLGGVALLVVLLVVMAGGNDDASSGSTPGPSAAPTMTATSPPARGAPTVTAPGPDPAPPASATASSVPAPPTSEPAPPATTSAAPLPKTPSTKTSPPGPKSTGTGKGKGGMKGDLRL